MIYLTYIYTIYIEIISIVLKNIQWIFHNINQLIVLEKASIQNDSYLVAVKILVPRENRLNKQHISLTDAWTQSVFLCVVPHIVSPHITLCLCDVMETEYARVSESYTENQCISSSWPFKYYISLRSFFSILIVLLSNRLSLMNMIS